jgi:predicted metal-binding protein
MKWSEEAQQALERVPGFVRKMARRAVEQEVRKKGLDTVELDDVTTVQGKYLGYIGKEESDKTRVAVVRCEIVSEVCPGVACFKSFNRRENHFADYQGEVEMVGFFTCGGCPGRRAFRLADSLMRYGVDVVHLSSCMLLEEEYPRCPHAKQIKKMLESKGLKVVEGTHH